MFTVTNAGSTFIYAYVFWKFVGIYENKFPFLFVGRLKISLGYKNQLCNSQLY